MVAGADGGALNAAGLRLETMRTENIVLRNLQERRGV